jgi:hypothetical protein
MSDHQTTSRTEGAPRVAAAVARVEAEAHADVVARDPGQVALPEVRVREVALEKRAACPIVSWGANSVPSQ